MASCTTQPKCVSGTFWQKTNALENMSVFASEEPPVLLFVFFGRWNTSNWNRTMWCVVIELFMHKHLRHKRSTKPQWRHWSEETRKLMHANNSTNLFWSSTCVGFLPESTWNAFRLGCTTNKTPSVTSRKQETCIIIYLKFHSPLLVQETLGVRVSNPLLVRQSVHEMPRQSSVCTITGYCRSSLTKPCFVLRRTKQLC